MERLAEALERQNRLRRRFVSGLFFGVGTVIGASVVASPIVVGLVRVFDLVGLSGTVLDQAQAAATLERQLRLQTPNQQ